MRTWPISATRACLNCPLVSLSLSLSVCVCFLAQAHMADEWVLVADLIKMDAVLEKWLTTP